MWVMVILIDVCLWFLLYGVMLKVVFCWSVGEGKLRLRTLMFLSVIPLCELRHASYYVLHNVDGHAQH
jgi:hypothetical protein